MSTGALWALPSLSTDCGSFSPARASLLEEALAACGHRVLATLPSASGLLKQVECQRPDAVIVDLESPDRDVLEAMSLLNHHQPLPVLMFAASDDPEQIQRAVKATGSRPAA